MKFTIEHLRRFIDIAGKALEDADKVLRVPLAKENYKWAGHKGIFHFQGERMLHTLMTYQLTCEYELGVWMEYELQGNMVDFVIVDEEYRGYNPLALIEFKPWYFTGERQLQGIRDDLQKLERLRGGAAACMAIAVRVDPMEDDQQIPNTKIELLKQLHLGGLTPEDLPSYTFKTIYDRQDSQFSLIGIPLITG